MIISSAEKRRHSMQYYALKFDFGDLKTSDVYVDVNKFLLPNWLEKKTQHKNP